MRTFKRESERSQTNEKEKLQVKDNQFQIEKRIREFKREEMIFELKKN